MTNRQAPTEFGGKEASLAKLPSEPDGIAVSAGRADGWQAARVTTRIVVFELEAGARLHREHGDELPCEYYLG